MIIFDSREMIVGVMREEVNPTLGTHKLTKSNIYTITALLVIIVDLCACEYEDDDSADNLSKV